MGGQTREVEVGRGHTFGNGKSRGRRQSKIIIVV